MKKKQIVLVLISLLFIVTIPISVFLIGQRQELRKKAAPASTLSLTPPTSTRGTGRLLSLEAWLTPGSNQVTAATMYIDFNPAFLQLTTLTIGSGLQELGARIVNNTTGNVSFSVGSGPLQPITTVQSLAQLTFMTTSQTGTATVSFSRTSPRKTVATAINETIDVLTGTTGATITIAVPTPTPTPTIPPDPGKVNVMLKLTFQGITTHIANKTAKITLIPKTVAGVSLPQTFNAVPIDSDGNGIYARFIATMGTYDIYVKGWAHLQKKFANQTIASPDTLLDFTHTSLLAGDVVGAIDSNGHPTGDNTINIVDLGKLTDDYYPNTPSGSSADLNLDGVVNIIDIGIVTDNYATPHGDSYE